MGDADIADLPRRLHLPQGREMGAPVLQIVDLDQVNDLGAQPLGRPAHLGDPLLLAASPDLGREKDARAHPQLGDEIAGHRLGAGIHRRGVDHPPPGINQPPHHLLQRRPLCGVLADIEHAPGAEPDDRHRLAGRWDRPGDHRRSGHGVRAPKKR
jgi:hypothetical protein